MVKKIWDSFNQSGKWIGAAIVLFMLLSVNYEVVMRYFLNRPTIWSVEMNEYVLVYLVFLVVGWIQWGDDHIKVDAVTRLLSKSQRETVAVVTKSISFIFSVMLMWLTGKLALEFFIEGARFSGNLELPKFPLYISLPIGFLTLAVNLLIQILRSISKIRKRTSS